VRLQPFEMPTSARKNHYIHASWLMDAREQQRVGIHIGRNYPAPIVDHAAARRITLEMYATAKLQQI
jgi:deoxyribodipyrimidine photo-lyase